ncbi:uncharacterized protein LOC127835239 [Dreissena polymorpha]|uniref:uncharacterized protein LOC127835239 n=1 Tax=Dreissena polymorpha TaxID=45954 RepID=UPI00226403A7|nr:uncharacterized protein LOC127835239 [Dreissena polymorpha]
MSTLSLGKLWPELRKRNAKLSGRKKELIERLEAYDRNHNFNNCEELMPAFRMQIPATSFYKDVNTNMKMAPVDREKANVYMERVKCVQSGEVKVESSFTEQLQSFT